MKQIRILIGLSLLSCSLHFFSGAASASAPSETIEQFLAKFHADPERMMMRLPSKVKPDGRVVPGGFIDTKKVAERLEFRNDIRGEIISRSESFRLSVLAEITDDRAEKLVEPGDLVRNLAEMEHRNLTRHATEVAPWADSYWPTYRGQIAFRYADPSFPDTKSWLMNHEYVLTRPASGIAASGDAHAIDQLSPAEKYDLALGDFSFTLTSYAWNQGLRYQTENGAVATWMGICHGWAAASHMLSPYPENPVTVHSPSGQPIVFHGRDVQALESMLWANARVPTRFVGSRCNVSSPGRDPNGRTDDPKCFDPNPGTWHLAVVNQIGIHRRSFVMDATYDAEVWNFPLVHYAYRYFNPETWREAPTLAQAAVPVEKYRRDPFKPRRSPKTKYVVGIFMDVGHVSAITPVRHKINTPVAVVRHVYDLELDANYNIVGGEWYSHAHPDFIWTFDRSAQAMAVGDSGLTGEFWNALMPVPSHWIEPAQRSSNRGTPLFSFLQGLSKID